MTKSLVFFTGRTQISDCSEIARALNEEGGVRNTLITLGNYNKVKGEEEDSFDRVKDILPKINFEITDEQAEKDKHLLQRLSSIVGAQSLGRAIASDRYIGAMRPTGTWYKDHPFHWNRRRIHAFIARTGIKVLKYLRTRRPNAVFVESSSALYCITRELCKYLKIKSFFISSPRIWNNRIYAETENDFLWYECRNRYASLSKCDIGADLKSVSEKRLSEFRAKQSQPDYHKNVTSGAASLLDNLKLDEIIRYTKMWVRFINEPWRKNPRSYVSKFLSPLGLIRRFMQRKKSEKIYNDVVNPKPDLERQYVVYFLHVQPEATVDFMAQRYRNQLSTIRNISALLPPNIPLYVKEHKPMVGRRTSEFYAEMFHIPNVVLVDHDIHSHIYIRNSEAVITLTGTPGLESVLYGVPSIALGNIFYSVFDGVYDVQNWEDAREILSAIPNGLNNPSTDDAIRILASTYSASSPGVWPPDTEKAPELTRKTADVFYSMLD